MAKQMMLTLTFKDNEKWIYDEICKHSSKGGWVKDILADHIKNNIPQETKIENVTSTNVDVASFLKF